MESIRGLQELVNQIISRLRKDRGAFLVEILVSVVILGVVGLVIFNSISSSHLQNRKTNSNAETITRLTSAAEILAATPFAPCSQGNPNPYQSLAERIAPVEIAAIYGVTNSGIWSYCLNNFKSELISSEGESSPWPSGENASRIQKVILRAPTGLTRSVFKSFDNKLGNYGLGGTFKTSINSIDTGAPVTNFTLEVGVPQSFKLTVLNPKNPSNNILYFITQGSSNLYSSPSIQATIDGDILTVLAPKYGWDGKTRNTTGRANIDVEAFDTVAALQATPVSLGLSVIIPPLQTVIKTPLVTLISGSDSGTFQPIGVKGVYDPFTFNLLSPPELPAGIKYNSTNSTFSGTPTTAWPSTTYTIEVTDTLNTKVSGAFNMQVVDPLSISNLITGRTLYSGSAITSFSPFTTLGGLTPYTYSISPSLPAGLTLNTGSGLISGTPTGPSPVKDFTVTVSDNQISGYIGQSKSHTFSIRVFDPFTVTSSTPTKVIVQNAQTSFTPVTATGGADPYIFSISPALPSGLSMDSTTGTISGTPTALTAATTYTVTVRDSISPTPNSGSATFSLQVLGPLAISNISSGMTFYVGVAVSQNPFTTSGGVTPYKYSISPKLPSGLSINSSTGLISGTPTVKSNLNTYTVTVQDSMTPASSKSASFDIRVLDKLVVTAVASSWTFAIGTPVSVSTVSAQGGISPYTYSLTAGSLPDGLTFNKSTGVISGTPTKASASSSYTVTVNDSVTPQSNASSVSFKITVR